tara:strand:- start:16438 stop:16662 length:225 start_codon:yes stop_codon:yes gene_type:complete
MSDKQTILNILKRNENTYVCSGVFIFENRIKDYAQRISELRSEGHDIIGFVCTEHNHKLFMYKLKVEYFVDSLF